MGVLLCFFLGGSAMFRAEFCPRTYDGLIFSTIFGDNMVLRILWATERQSTNYRVMKKKRMSNTCVVLFVMNFAWSRAIEKSCGMTRQKKTFNRRNNGVTVFLGILSSFGNNCSIIVVCPRLGRGAGCKGWMIRYQLLYHERYNVDGPEARVYAGWCGRTLRWEIRIDI